MISKEFKSAIEKLNYRIGLMTPPLSARMNLSLGGPLVLLDSNGDCSGLKLNASKGGMLWLGKNSNRTDSAFEIKSPQRPFCALGTSFTYNLKLCETDNCAPKITKLQKRFNIR